MKRVPRSFKLLGHLLRVEILSAREWQGLAEKYPDEELEDAVGYISPTDKLILVKRGCQSDMLHIFCHELVHAILDAMNSPLSKDEVFVDNFAGLLAQALSTFAR